MSAAPFRSLRLLGSLLASGSFVVSTLAQTELPALQTSGSTNTRTLERPPTYDLPSPATSAASRGRSTGNSSSRSTAAIPDPSIFDGSQFPPEERPEQGLIATLEMPGSESQERREGPGDEPGGGGDGPGGDSDQPGGGGGIQVGLAGPQIPGLSIPGLGGAGGAPGGLPGLPSIPTLDTGDQGKPGQSGPEGQPGGEPGKPGGPAPADAPKVAGNQGRQLEKPSAVQIGDPNAKLAEAGSPQADPSKSLESAQGEDRMQIKAAAGSQSGNRDRGTERGVDIPSNL